MDTTGDRDFALEFLFCCTVIQLHLSRLAEELVLWSSKEFDFVEIGDRYCTGSSIMPQKKNPDIPELIQGQVGSGGRSPDGTSDDGQGIASDL